MTRSSSIDRAAVAALVASGVLGGLTAPAARAQAPVTPVARSGNVAPGTGGATFFAYNAPVINQSATAAFSGFLAAQPSDQDFGIWMGRPGNLSLAAREGSSAPGTGGAAYSTLSQPLIDTDGNIAYVGTLVGSGIYFSNNRGLWVGSTGGGIQLAARTGDVAPGTGGAGTFDFVSESTLIAGGKVSFYGSLASSSLYNGLNDDGIWAGAVGSLQLVAREGTQADGAASGQLFGSFNITPVINASGAVAFRNVMTGTGITPGVNDRGMWAGPAGGLQLLARAGDAPPGFGGGVVFADFSTQPAINSAGTVAFRGTLTGGTVTTSNDTGIWFGTTSANLAVLAREGAQAPGLPTGVTYGQMPDFVVMNGAGRAAFVAPLSGTADSSNNKAVFAGPTGGLQPLARKGWAAPGTGAGVVFSDFEFSVAMNPSGQAAFIGNLGGAGVVSGNNTGIWAVDPFGQLTKVAREGDAITLDPGDTRTIGDFGLAMFLNSAGGEGKWTSFNDSSQLIYSAFFSDNTRAVLTARVGGSARLTDTAPVLGPAVANGYGTVTPADFQETVAVSGDIGYLRFSGVAPAGANALILLDFSASSSIANAMQELNRGAAIYNYTVSTTSVGTFDVLLTFIGANPASGYFYWNFANVDDVDLVAVQVAPEPGTGLLVTALGVTALRRRPRKPA